MTRSDWEAVKHELGALLELSTAQRSAALAQLREDSPALDASHPGFGKNGARLAEARLALAALRAGRALAASD